MFLLFLLHSEFIFERDIEHCWRHYLYLLRGSCDIHPLVFHEFFHNSDVTKIQIFISRMKLTSMVHNLLNLLLRWCEEGRKFIKNVSIYVHCKKFFFNFCCIIIRFPCQRKTQTFRMSLVVLFSLIFGYSSNNINISVKQNFYKVC